MWLRKYDYQSGSLLKCENRHEMQTISNIQGKPRPLPHSAGTHTSFRVYPVDVVCIGEIHAKAVSAVPWTFLTNVGLKRGATPIKAGIWLRTVKTSVAGHHCMYLELPTIVLNLMFQIPEIGVFPLVGLLHRELRQRHWQQRVWPYHAVWPQVGIADKFRESQGFSEINFHSPFRRTEPIAGWTWDCLAPPLPATNWMLMRFTLEWSVHYATMAVSTDRTSLCRHVKFCINGL